jgi:hypothetical protein
VHELQLDGGRSFPPMQCSRGEVTDGDMAGRPGATSAR